MKTTIVKDKYKISRRAVLDINSEAVDYIPSAEDYKDSGSLLEQTAIAINKKMPVLFIGDTGTGKTSLVRFLASKTKNGFRRINHNGGTTVEDIIGRTLINKEGTYFVDGVLTEAMRKGLWYLADEINASTPEINFIYHSLLDDDGFIILPENKNEIVRPHKNFRFFGAMNPPTDYSGTKELNRSLLSRFIVVKTDFPIAKIEAKILTTRTTIQNETAEKMIGFAGEIRKSFKEQKLNFVLSTREMLAWAEMIEIYSKFIPSAETTILNKVDKEDYEAVKDILSLHFKGLDNPRKTTVTKTPVAPTT